MNFAPIFAGLLAQMPAPPVTLPIVWEAPRECPDRAALIDAIEQRIGRPLARDEVEVAGRITRHAQRPRWRLKLTLVTGGSSGERTLTAERCAPLVDATALLVALAIDQAPIEAPAPTEVTTEPTAEDTPPPAPNAADMVVRESADQSPQSVEVDDPETASEEPPAAPRPLTRPPGPGGFVRVYGGPELGAVPGVTGAFGLTSGILWRRARLEFAGIYLAAQPATRGESSLRVFVVAGSVQGCARLWSGPVEFPLCGGLEAGAMRGIAQGPGARSATGLWLAGVLSAGAAWHAHPRVTLSIALQAVLRLAWPRFELRDPGPAVSLFEPGIVSGRLLAGLELRFGDPR